MENSDLPLVKLIPKAETHAEQWIVSADGKEVGRLSCADLLAAAEGLLALQSRGNINAGECDSLMVYEMHQGRADEGTLLTFEIDGRCALLDKQGAYDLARALLAYKNQQVSKHWLIRKMSLQRQIDLV